MRQAVRLRPGRPVVTVLVCTACALFLGGCGLSDNPHLEGPVPSIAAATGTQGLADDDPSVAPGAPVPTAPGGVAGQLPTASDVRSVDLRAVLLADPSVALPVKRDLLGCATCDLLRPVYADLTGAGQPDVVVSVREAPQKAAATWATSGLGADEGGQDEADEDLEATYAYRVAGGRLQEIFAFTGDDYALAVRGPVVIVMVPVYGALDPRCCPTGVRVLRNLWNGSRLVTVSSVVTTGAP